MWHRRLIITLIYAQLVDNGSGEFTVKTSRTVEKAYSTVEAVDSNMLLRWKA